MCKEDKQAACPHGLYMLGVRGLHHWPQFLYLHNGEVMAAVKKTETMEVSGPRARTRVKQERHLGDKMQRDTHSQVWILHRPNRERMPLAFCTLVLCLSYPNPGPPGSE